MSKTVLAAVVCALTLCGACSDDDPISVPTETTVVGTYSLSVVNGGSLPFPLGANATTRIDIVAGFLRLTADKNFLDVLTTHEVALPEGVTRQEKVDTLRGTWSLQGSTLQMSYPQGVQSAVVTGDLITQDFGGLLMSYRR
jgi:hypothetical protein